MALTPDAALFWPIATAPSCEAKAEVPIDTVLFAVMSKPAFCPIETFPEPAIPLPAFSPIPTFEEPVTPEPAK
jgi:hypothetical protein